ncbi:endonuclease/exonuclease/phosphatase family protein [Nonomuraea soli]|uniref:Endonuclease/exonuclease/phosphatase family metal-dependent hydrolase n=1 Tax=Nonomuraea soli TaxID=1032476 RepID=A0A7W0CEF5_9ACTN|nr:endonuclease/exonuclease/phosphatase family protein [Nonomuraea soli]MBA2889517.1 endonuclease/exonuclease/phosphatase family metal-dependent hydrolase [Nonomuraea soli]
MRIGTYNIRGMHDDVPALVRVIQAMDCDVLCVQEAPKFLWWRSKRHELADLTGMRIAAGRRLAGLAVYVRPGVKVLHEETHVLKIFFPREIRGLALAVVEVEGVRLAVGSIHLALVPAQRLHHANQIMSLVEAAAARFSAIPVVCGDLNETDHQPTWRYFAGRLSDCYPAAPRGDGRTFTARNPSSRIDAVFAGPGLRIDWCGGAEAAPADLVSATDHLPVIASLTPAPPPADTP